MSFWSSIGNALGKVGSSVLGGIPIVGDVVGSLVNANATKKANQANMRNSLELARVQNEYNVQNWRMQNDYNSPASQMKRLQEAGLNPNLVYGNGADNTASSISSPSVHQSDYRPVNYGDTFHSIADSLARYLQLQKMSLENKNLASQNDKTIAEIDSVKALTQGYGYNNDYLRQTLLDRVEGISLANDLSRGNISLTGARVRNTNAGTRQIESAIRLNNANVRLIKSKTKLTDAQVSEVNQRINESVSRIILNLARAKNVNTETALRAAMSPYIVNKIAGEAMSAMSKGSFDSALYSDSRYVDSIVEKSLSDRDIRNLEYLITKEKLFDVGHGLDTLTGSPFKIAGRFYNSFLNLFK